MYEYLILALLITFSLFITFAVLYFKNLSEFSKLSRLRNDFMAMMIHELRSPLSVTKGSANMLLNEPEKFTGAQQKALIKQIEDSAADLLNVVSDLLDVSKIEAGKIELFKHQTNIIGVLKEEVEKYRNIARQRNLELSIRVPTDDLELNCDPDKIKHIMSNLISNAMKFTQDGEIKVEVRDLPDYIEVTVADTGIGIPSSLKTKVFDKFVQARALPVSREKGTGLGLVIVKGMVEAHGGKIWIEDNYPKGTKMVYTLPKC